LLIKNPKVTTAMVMHLKNIQPEKAAVIGLIHGIIIIV